MLLETTDENLHNNTALHLSVDGTGIDHNRNRFFSTNSSNEGGCDVFAEDMLYTEWEEKKSA